MYGTYRFGKRKKKEKTLNPTLKNVNNLQEKVKEYMIFLRDCDAKTFKEEMGSTRRCFTKERIAEKFKVRPHEIEQCFVELNKEGILSQATRNHAHDTSREPYGYGNVSGWAADIYSFIDPLDKWFGAIMDGKFEKIEKMLESGTDINAKSGDNSALAIALYTKNIKMIHFLLEKGADPTIDGNFQVFSDVLGTGDFHLVSEFLKHASNKFIENEDGEDILFEAACKYSEFLPLLLENGFSIEKRNKYKQTPLIVASIHTQSDSFKFLVSKGANLKAKDRANKTAFMYAIEVKNIEILKLFIPFRDKLTREEKKLFKKIRMRLLF